MDSVFLNYAREDRELVLQVAHALRDLGISVWLDMEIPIGKEFLSAIEDAVRESDCMLTFWTQHSVKANWVLAEAELGYRELKLLPVAIAVDPRDLSAPFNTLQTEFLTFEEAASENAPKRIAAIVANFLERAPTAKRQEKKDNTVLASAALAQPPEYETPSLGNKKAFISYASEDEDTAIELVESLERSGCPCWISFRDVDPGEDYRNCIVRAIAEVRFLVLLYSEHVNRSFDVANELLLARKRNRHRFFLKMDESEPDGPVEYELASVQWIDGHKDKKAAFDRLCQRARLF